MKSILYFLRKFFTKIIFNSKHFNYNIHFLHIVSVRWRPLSTHSPKLFWKFCITRCSMLRETAATSSLMFCFKSTVVFGFFSWDILRGRSIATRDTRSDGYWSADEISSESRQNRYWNTSPQQKPDALQTSAPWQLKCFEYQKSAQGQIPHANGSTHNCFAKPSGISAGHCTRGQVNN